MKKFCFSLCLSLVLIFSFGCTNNNAQNSGSQKSEALTNNSTQSSGTVPAIKDYFSYAANTKYTFEGQGNEYATYTVFVDYIVDNRIQTRTNNGGTETVEVLENKDGELAMVFSKGECYYRENLTQSAAEDKEVLLKEPLIKGTTWTLADNRKRFISNTDVDITIPMGSYKAIEVTTEGVGDKTVDYYAPNIGLIKSVFTPKESEITSTLSKMESNTPFVQTVKFYYPNANAEKVVYVNKQLSFQTNDYPKVIIENAYKDLHNQVLNRTISPNAKIKSLYLNKDKMVYVDFTKEFVSEMNAGSGVESKILQSITNTLGVYYTAEKVYITVEGNPYSSGHILLKKGEFFTVNLKDCFEQK
jgi:spore germination protein GerM